MEIKRSIKEIFDENIRIRKLDDESDMSKFGVVLHNYGDWMGYEYLLRDYDETISFLTQANEEEIAFSVEFLEHMVLHFPNEKVQSIINIFREKFVEFPNVGNVCRFDYMESIDEAQGVLDEKEK